MSDDLVRMARASASPPHYIDTVKGIVQPLTHVLADQIEAQAAEIARLRVEQGEARGYLSRLLQSLYPSIEILPDMLGVCTQIDNVLAGRREEITRLRAALATARREVEQERDEFFNRLGRITEYLDIRVDATAQRIIEAIQERVDSERESCASVEVRLAVPEGAETWTPLEAWEEALLAFDEAFRDAIRATAKEKK